MITVLRGKGAEKLLLYIYNKSENKYINVYIDCIYIVHMKWLHFQESGSFLIISHVLMYRI